MLLEDEYSDSINSLYNVPLQNTTKFKDLDSFIFQNKPNTGDIETNHCIRMAYAKSATMANLLQNSTIHLKTKVKFRNTFVHSRLMYSCQNRNSTVVQFEKLEVTNWNLLRRMIRGGLKSIGDNDGDPWYKLNNEKIQAICCTSNVSNFVRKQRKSYAGYVVRMPIEHYEKQLILNDDKYHRIGRVTTTLLEQVLKFNNCTIGNHFFNSSSF